MSGRARSLPGFPGGRYPVLQSERGERESEAGGLRVEAEGKMTNVKAQMPNVKVQMEESLGERKNEL